VKRERDVWRKLGRSLERNLLKGKLKEGGGIVEGRSAHNERERGREKARRHETRGIKVR